MLIAFYHTIQPGPGRKLTQFIMFFCCCLWLPGVLVMWLCVSILLVFLGLFVFLLWSCYYGFWCRITSTGRLITAQKYKKHVTYVQIGLNNFFISTCNINVASKQQRELMVSDKSEFNIKQLFMNSKKMLLSALHTLYSSIIELHWLYMIIL